MTDTVRDEEVLSTEPDCSNGCVDPVGHAAIGEEERVHLLDSIRDLEYRLARAEQEALGARLAHIREVQIISNEMNEQADEHELCGVYDNVVANVNTLLKVPMLTRDVDVSIRARGTITFDFDRRITLAVPMGSNADDAVVRERTLGVLTSLGLRNMTTSVGDSIDIEMDPLTW